VKIAVIPARGGSKRIPHKNIRDFCGKPIIAWSIEAAIKSKLFDQVIVSTDDETIAEVAKQYGAEVPFVRPKKLSDDFTGTNDVVKHAIQWFHDNGQNVDYACCIYATAPFIQLEYLKQGHDKLLSLGKSFVFSVTTFPYPVQRALHVKNDGLIEAVWMENIYARSQDLEELFHDAGQFYWGKASAFLEDVVMLDSTSLPVVLPRYLVQDIDTEEDWVRAEMMFKSYSR
jgi:pseudaminic acid cytidylyltransferase